jgi:hypothetical protein
MGVETANIHLGSGTARKTVALPEEASEAIAEGGYQMVDVARVDWRRFTSAV